MHEWCMVVHGCASEALVGNGTESVLRTCAYAANPLRSLAFDPPVHEVYTLYTLIIDIMFKAEHG